MPSSISQKPVHQSLTIAGALAMAAAFASDRLGITAPPGAIEGLVQSLIDLVFYLGLLGVGIGRARANAPLV